MEKQKAAARGANSNLLLGGIMIGLGVLFLLGELFNISLGAWAWPLFILVPGALMLATGLRLSDESGVGLTIAGTIVATVGLILFVQNLTGWWASWAYAWALVAPTSVGVAQILNGNRRHQEKMRRDGRSLIKIGLTMFVVGFIFFELIIGVSGFGLGSLGWPVLLIAFGLYLLLRNILSNRAHK